LFFQETAQRVLGGPNNRRNTIIIRGKVCEVKAAEPKPVVWNVGATGKERKFVRDRSVGESNNDTPSDKFSRDCDEISSSGVAILPRHASPHTGQICQSMDSSVDTDGERLDENPPTPQVLNTMQYNYPPFNMARYMTPYPSNICPPYVMAHHPMYLPMAPPAYAPYGFYADNNTSAFGYDPTFFNTYPLMHSHPPGFSPDAAMPMMSPVNSAPGYYPFMPGMASSPMYSVVPYVSSENSAAETQESQKTTDGVNNDASEEADSATAKKRDINDACSAAA